MTDGNDLAATRRAYQDLFLVSLLLLFLELACIRWFPAHVLYLTFFTNTVLLACFLGMSVGCLAAQRTRDYLTWTPSLLGLAVMAALGVEFLQGQLSRVLDVGNQASAQVVYFGTEAHTPDVSKFVVPIEVLCGFFFLVLALTLVGPGQELGRAFSRVPHRVQAYSLNILGSIVGIVMFALFSWLELSPFWWFLPVALGLLYLLGRDRPVGELVGPALLLGMVLVAVALRTGVYRPAGAPPREFLWSPYYRIDYDQEPHRMITVNLIGHQSMVTRTEPNPEYALPHLLNRDAGGQPFLDVLIIGAGSGNDLSRALQWGARSIDAVEIDPVIQRLGRRDHPDRPYDDPRIRLHIDDGRNFLRAGDRHYDLILYALVDSLVLHSGYSNIRLESYLFTRQAFADVRRHLKPGGLFITYNFFRQGWIVSRIQRNMEEVFGSPPLVLTLPYHEVIRADDMEFQPFTMFVTGDDGRLESLRRAFAEHPRYWLRNDQAPSLDTPNGFRHEPTQEEKSLWSPYGLARVIAPAESVPTASDDWPFLYLRRPMIPNLSLRGMGIMALLSLLLIGLFLPRRQGVSRTFSGRMFFLGAGFMLVETKAVIHMALLFGSTWMVNSVVFFAVLVMILAANLFVLAVRPERLWPYYLGLLAALALNVLIPLDSFLGLDRLAQVAGACALVFTPILFAGVIFAVSFQRSAAPDYDFGANIAGAICGGLAENTSMLLGFQNLLLVALAFYALSALAWRSTPAAVTSKS